MNQEQAYHYFLKHNADGVTAFHLDICNNASRALNKLSFAKKYALVPAASMLQGWSVLHIAAQFAAQDTLKKLLASGLFVMDALDNQRRTPLHIAAIAGRLDIALLLINAGSNTHLQDHAGFTAFHDNDQPLDKCYVKFSSADVNRLATTFNAKRKSLSGLPLLFPTRELPAETSYPVNLQQLIQTYNLTGDTSLADQAQLGTHAIPFYGHFFWIGSPFDNPDYRQNILTFNAHFPELTLILWVDHPTEEVIAWSLVHHIVLLSTDLLLDSAFQNIDHYQLDIHKGNPGAAVDNLRIECLYRFGGWYFDTDVQCVQRITSADYADFHTLLFFHKTEGKPFWNNCILATTPGNSYFKLVRNIIANNYLHARYDAKSRILSGYDMRHKMTINTSGPGCLYPLLCMYIIGADAGIGTVDVNKFATSCDRNWIRPEKKFTHLVRTKAEALIALQQVVNNIAHDLWFDPQTLYFDLYEPLFAKFPEYHLASFTLYFLLSFYQQSLNSVKRLITFERLVQEINYKNQFSNQDIIAYYKKDLQMVESQYTPLAGLKMQCYEAIHEIDRNALFYSQQTWQEIKTHILYNTDKAFSDQATVAITKCLLQDKRILAMKKLAALLAQAWQHQRLEQQRRIIVELGRALSEHFNRTSIS